MNHPDRIPAREYPTNGPALTFPGANAKYLRAALSNAQLYQLEDQFRKDNALLSLALADIEVEATAP
jgi:hypothetical protein